MPQKKSATWEERLRRALRAEHGNGWGIRESMGRAQLVRINEDRSRSSTKLEIQWSANSHRLLLEAVAEIRERIDCHGMTFKEAAAARLELNGEKNGADDFIVRHAADAFARQLSLARPA